MSSPRISVLMPAYNACRWLEASIASLQAQTFGDFELIVINDASTDGTADLLRKLQSHEPRLKVIHNAQNQRIARSLNAALDEARGTYIARLDADDLAYPHRLAHQVAWLDAHPDVALLGSRMRTFGQLPPRIMRYPTEDSALRAHFFVGNPFAHPTVMLRREVLERHALRYDPSFETAEDYELWLRVAKHAPIANLATVTVKYRLSPTQVTATTSRDAIASTTRILKAASAQFLAPSTPELDAALEVLAPYGITPHRFTDQTLHTLPSVITAYHRLIDALRAAKSETFDADHAVQELKRRMTKVWLRHARLPEVRSTLDAAGLVDLSLLSAAQKIVHLYRGLKAHA